MKLTETTNEVFEDLEDAAQEVWTNRTEMEGYVRDGYDQLCRRTLCVWDIVYAENLPYTGNHVAEWEFDVTPFESNSLLAIGQVANYRLEETTGTRFDSVNHNDLTPTGAPGSTAGKAGTALNLVAASSQFLSVASNPSLQSQGQSIIIAVWVKPTTISGAKALVTKDNGFPGDREWGLYIDGVGKYSFEIHTQFGSFSTTYQPVTAVAGNWNLVIAWVDNSEDKFYMQVDDFPRQQGLALNGARVNSLSADFRVGKTGNLSDHFNGAVDELIFWVGRVMTQEDRSRLWNGGDGLSFSQAVSGPVARFGGLILGRFTFTGKEWERDYSDNGVGPANHTSLWEVDFITTDLFLATALLPETLLQVDRVTFDNYKIDCGTSGDARASDHRYQYTAGPPSAYITDQDGLMAIRKIPVPSARADVFVHTGNRGTIRNVTANEFGTGQTVVGLRGALRVLDEHHPSGAGRGAPKRAYDDTKNVRVEIYRRGDLTSDEFEIPDHYVRYVKHYAMSKAREREGPGQDLKLAKHDRARFEMGITRINDRKRTTARARTGRLGSTGYDGRMPPTARLPWQYPKVP